MKKKEKKDRTEMVLNVTRKRLTGVDARLFVFAAGLRFVSLRVPRIGTIVVPWDGRKKGEIRAVIYDASMEPEEAVGKAMETVIDSALTAYIRKDGKKKKKKKA